MGFGRWMADAKHGKQYQNRHMTIHELRGALTEFHKRAIDDTLSIGSQTGPTGNSARQTFESLAPTEFSGKPSTQYEPSLRRSRSDSRLSMSESLSVATKKSQQS